MTSHKDITDDSHGARFCEGRWWADCMDCRFLEPAYSSAKGGCWTFGWYKWQVASPKAILHQQPPVTSGRMQPQSAMTLKVIKTGKKKKKSNFFLIITALKPTAAIGWSGGSQVSNRLENLFAFEIFWRSFFFSLVISSLSEYTCVDFSRSDLIKLCQILQRL